MSQNLPIHSPPTTDPALLEEQSPKNRILTFTLASLTGFLGLHRFYTGRFFTGLLMLFSVGGFFVWWFFDVLLILSGRFKDGKGRVLGPPRRLPPPAGHLPLARPQAPEDDIDLEALLEDPLEEEFRQLERELKQKNNRPERGRPRPPASQHPNGS